MKKILACLLALTMVLGLGTSAFAYEAQHTTGAPTLTVEGTYDKDAGTIKVLVKIAAESLLANGRWSLDYDSALLEYDAAASAAAVRPNSAKGTVNLVAPGEVQMAYMEATGLFDAITLCVAIFNVLDADAPKATFTLSAGAEDVKVIDSDDLNGDAAYAVAFADVVKDVVIKPVTPITPSTSGPATPEVDPAVKGLVEQIKALLSDGNADLSGEEGLTAFFNAFSNGSLNDILDDILGGETGGLSLDALKGYLNQIIALISGGGESTPAGPGSSAPVPSASNNKVTTTGKSGASLPNAGDAGIALAATVCLAAAAAFVMSRKNKED